MEINSNNNEQGGWKGHSPSSWNGHSPSNWASTAVQQQNVTNTRKRKQTELKVKKYENSQKKNNERGDILLKHIERKVDAEGAWRRLKRFSKKKILKFIANDCDEKDQIDDMKLYTQKQLIKWIEDNIQENFITKYFKLIELKRRVKKAESKYQDTMLYIISLLMIKKGISFTFLAHRDDTDGEHAAPLFLDNKPIQFKLHETLASGNLVVTANSCKHSDTTIHECTESCKFFINCSFDSRFNCWRTMTNRGYRNISYQNLFNEFFIKSLFIGMEICTQIYLWISGDNMSFNSWIKDNNYTSKLGIINKIDIQQGTFDVQFNDGLDLSETFYLSEDLDEITYRNHINPYSSSQFSATDFAIATFDNDEALYMEARPQNLKIIRISELDLVHQYRKDYDYYLLKHLSETNLSVFDGISGILDIIACYVGENYYVFPTA